MFNNPAFWGILALLAAIFLITRRRRKPLNRPLSRREASLVLQRAKQPSGRWVTPHPASLAHDDE